MYYSIHLVALLTSKAQVDPFKEIEDELLALDWSPHDPQTLLLLMDDGESSLLVFHLEDGGAAVALPTKASGAIDGKHDSSHHFNIPVSWCPSKDKTEFACLTEDGIHFFFLEDGNWAISEAVEIKLNEEHANPHPLSIKSHFSISFLTI